MTTDKPGGLMDSIGTMIAEKILPKLVELLWPKIVDLFEQVLLPKIVSMFPLFAATIAKTVVDQIPGVNLVKDVVDVAEQVRDTVNVAIPDFDIPGLSDKFDLTDWLNKLGGRR